MVGPLSSIAELRRRLHRRAELSSREERTSAIIAEVMAGFGPQRAIHRLGGYGAAYVFEAQEPGPTVLLRCELDALPIPETIDIGHASLDPLASHKCGHDGHMAMVVGVAADLAARPHRQGRAVLLFQPAEETGEGAARVLADPRFETIAPDFAVALHNLPGRALGSVVVRRGVFNCASVGLTARLLGRTSHAAEPESARSPAEALAGLVLELPGLAGGLNGRGLNRGGPDGGGSDADSTCDGALLTVTHAALGEPTFGVTPGAATLMATLRATSDSALEGLATKVERRIEDSARRYGLGVSIERREPFRAVLNAPDLVDRVLDVAHELGLEVEESDRPLRWSEDFAEFARRGPAVLFGLGAGVDQPPLHSPEYDFPDVLLPIGVKMLRRVLDDLVR